MTLLKFPLNGTDGTVLAAGDAATIGASQITVSGASQISLANAMGKHGTGLRLAPATSTNCLVRFAFNASSAQAQVTVEVTLPSSAPGANLSLVAIRHSAGVVGRLGVSTAGQFYFIDSAGTITTLTGTAVTWGNRYRVSLVITGASTTAGAVVAKAYPSGSGTAQQTATLTTANLTANNITHVQFGDAPGTIAVHGFDELQMNDGSGSEIPEYVVVNNPPTVTVTGNQNLATGATATITVSASDTDGTIASRALAFDFPSSGAPTITGGGTTSPSFPVGASEGVLYELTETVTDDGGATGTASTEVRVPLTTNADAKPLLKDATKVGSWTRVGGSATDGAALNDASDTTYLESSAVSGTEQKANIRLQPRSALASGAQIGVKLRSDTGTTTWQIRLYEGATLRQSWTQSAVGTTFTEYLFTISDPTLAAITDWGNLRVEVGVTT